MTDALPSSYYPDADPGFDADTDAEFPSAPRFAQAVRTACQTLIDLEFRLFPADPIVAAGRLGLPVTSVHALEQLSGEAGHRVTPGEREPESFLLHFGKTPVVVYRGDIASQDRIRFSLCHELGHYLMNHARWDESRLTPAGSKLLEDEANAFARNFLCPPPVLDMLRLDRKDPRCRRLFGLSAAAWQVRLDTLEGDRRLIPQGLATRLLVRFRPYILGRRCRACGAVFTDEGNLRVCRACGNRHLAWNPTMETAAEARSHVHIAGALAEDLAPRLGGGDPDLTAYWEALEKR